MTRALAVWWDKALTPKQRTEALAAREQHLPQWMVDSLHEAGVDVGVGTFADGSTRHFPPLPLSMFLAMQRQVVETT